MIPVVFCSPAISADETTEELNAKITALEKRLGKVEAAAEVNSAWFEDINSRLQGEVEITGYIDTEFDVTNQAGQNNHFGTRHFSVLVGRQINQEWRIFAETEYANAPIINPSTSNAQSSGTILMEQVYIERVFMPELKIRAGRFITPAGIWLVNHYSPFTLTQVKPQHITKIFPEFLDGAMMSGAFSLNDLVLAYHIFGANGEGNTGSFDSNPDKTVGGRLSLLFPSFYNLKVGVSSLTDVLNDKDAASKTASGVDLQFRVGPFKVQGEYAAGDYSDSADPSLSYKSVGYYVQPQYDIGKLTVFYRYDYYDPGNSNADKVTVNTAGINYHWTPVIVTKIENNNYAYTGGMATAGYAEWIFSAAIMF